MSRYGATKRRILELVAQGNNNLSRISEILKLSPSTVSKHLHDLEEEGSIKLQDNEHFRKWKTYSIADTRPRESGENSMRVKAFSATALLVLALLGAYLYITYSVMHVP